MKFTIAQIQIMVFLTTVVVLFFIYFKTKKPKPPKNVHYFKISYKLLQS